MAVVTGGVAGRADIADGLSLAHGLASRDSPLGLVGVHSTGPIAVRDDHVVSVRGAIGRDDHHAALGRPDGRTAGRRNVTAAVELLAVVGAVPVAEGRGYSRVPRHR